MVPLPLLQVKFRRVASGSSMKPDSRTRDRGQIDEDANYHSGVLPAPAPHPAGMTSSHPRA
jgi:hypothetical protein